MLSPRRLPPYIICGDADRSSWDADFSAGRCPMMPPESVCARVMGSEEKKDQATEKQPVIGQIATTDRLGDRPRYQDYLHLKPSSRSFLLASLLRRARTISIQNATALGNKNRAVLNSQKRQGVFSGSRPISSSGVASDSRRRGHDTSCSALVTSKTSNAPKNKLLFLRFASGERLTLFDGVAHCAPELFTALSRSAQRSHQLGIPFRPQPGTCRYRDQTHRSKPRQWRRRNQGLLRRSQAGSASLPSL